MDKKTIIYCTLIACATLASLIGLAITLDVYSLSKPAFVLNLPEESVKAGDTVYVRQMGNNLKVEHYHNYPDQQERSSIYITAQ